MIVLRELAQAKINLYLHVTGKRADGYHLLDSLVAFTDFGDKLEIVPADTVTLEVKGQFAADAPVKDNIVFKAAEALKHHSSVKTGAGLTLHKNLPVGAGIGGGSADAAAALKLLARFWKINPPAPELHKIAVALGADVPACLRGGALYMSGIGEVLEVGPPIAGLPVVLASPGKPLLTRDVFSAYKGAFSTAARHPHAFASHDALIQFLQKTKNDLEPVAIKLMPEIKEVLEALGAEKDCLFTRMSGSGSCSFGCFSEPQAAQTAAQKISAAHPDWWVKATTLR